MCSNHWSPFVGETLAVKQEKGNRHDRFAIEKKRKDLACQQSTW